ncbi:MAG: hypothetical protein COZ91_01260 [Candidatus Nealsonbacteria bacterium CG_4_8_14_3_um_filter_39_7]|nr:MAG: hypothetical protein COZ91_01260 [Candidatus Nealsonbacteria bacterium CG_4_8_14_3_um_filter_39_7]
MEFDIVAIPDYWGAIALFCVSFVILFFSLPAFLKLIFDRGIKKRMVKKSLRFSLFLVRISKEKIDERKEVRKEEKEWISTTEHFLSSLTSLKKKGLLDPGQWISFEIAKIGKEIKFFTAVPEEIKESVKKQIYSFFPYADISELPQDYNIFSETEIIAGGEMKLSENSLLPIKTYLNLEADPLSNITNVLTKSEKDEEAVIQYVIRPATSSLKDRGREILKHIETGETFKKAYSETSIIRILLKPLFPEKKETTPPLAKAPDKELLDGINSKVSKDIFETTIRILVSVPKTKEAEGREMMDQVKNSFEQFSSPKTNSFRFIEKKGNNLKKLIFDFSFRIPGRESCGILSTEEISSIFHFPSPISQTPQVSFLESKKAAPPVNLPEEGLSLGFNSYREQKNDIKIKEDDRRRHFYAIGQTGTGKSAFLYSMAEQDIKNGKGLCVLDPHGDLINDLLGVIPEERKGDIILFEPGNMETVIGLNMLEYEPDKPEQKTFIINELINIFDKLYDLKQTGGPIFEQYARNSLLLLMDDPNETYTLMEVPKVLADAEFRKYLLNKCRNPLVKDFWEKEAEKAGGEATLANIVPYITSKFDVFIANDYMRAIIGQQKTSLEFRKIMDGEKILLCNLSKGKLGEANSSLLGLIIVGKILINAFARIEIPQEERKDFYLYMDEFQNFTTESVSTILAEARKYRLSLIMAHQYIGQLTDPIRKAVFGNVGTITSFRVGPEDAEFLEKEFEGVFNRQDLINLTNYNFYIKMIIDGQVSRPFNVQTHPPVKPDRAKAMAMREYSLSKNGLPREEVEKNIKGRLAFINEKRETI